MSKHNNLRTWLLSHPWVYALLAFVVVPVCFMLSQMVVHAHDATSNVKQLIPHAILIGWSTAILIIIIIKMSAPIIAKIVIACMICMPPYVIYRLLDQSNQIVDNPLFDASYLVILGITISYAIVKVERYKREGIG
jgi:hypothetical protein